MYKKLAKYYDLIYSFKDYKGEIKKIKKLIGKYKNSEGNELLDVGCGTGKHLEYLKDKFFCTGCDLNIEMLDIAKRNVKGVSFTQADMITMNLKREFDIILCLFSGIGHVKTYDNLEKTILNFSNHLKKGGVVIIEPWLTKSVYDAGRPGMTTYDAEDIKIARLNTTKIDNDISILEMYYLIAERDKDIEYFIEKHELGLFEIDKFLELMNKVGLKAEYLKDGLMGGRGLYIGIKN
ncbi:MAG: class I SAM-dependent methyltransferase [Promethearchaeota archaeon]|nr:MAG: class I SAM-dependent methyltransferase [Candidatus Lokiarchaeota archaeon]